VNGVEEPRGMCMRNGRLYVTCWDSKFIHVFGDLPFEVHRELGRLGAVNKVGRRRALAVLLLMRRIELRKKARVVKTKKKVDSRRF